MFSSLSESGFIPTAIYVQRPSVSLFFVLISFREWLHSYDTNFLLRFLLVLNGSHLFQRVASFLLLFQFLIVLNNQSRFSSLSESGFIPTRERPQLLGFPIRSSHLFQRVASFLRHLALYIVCNQTQTFSSLSESGFIPTKDVLGLFKKALEEFSSLSESGFIPTRPFGWWPREQNQWFSSLSESGFIPTWLRYLHQE